jgi:hypothetical protein
MREAFALILAFASGACETQADEPFANFCKEVSTDFYFCRNLPQDEGNNYVEQCVARGKKVREADEMCGQLWTDAYSCVAALSCEDFELWRTAPHDDPMIDFPCADEGQAFLAQCPDLALWSDP